MSSPLLLTRTRAAEHVLHAIAQARVDLLTPAVLNTLDLSTELRESEVMSSWDFGGHNFIMSGAAAVLGAAAVITAPLEVPTLLLGGAAVAVTHGLSALSGASAELARAAHEADFQRHYGFTRDNLLWSVVPAGVQYWYLAAGDGVLELALKRKAGPLGLGENGSVLGRLLRRLTSLLPGTPAEQGDRLEAAIRKAAADMMMSETDRAFDPAWRVVTAVRAGELLETRRTLLRAQQHAAAAGSAAENGEESDAEADCAGDDRGGDGGGASGGGGGGHVDGEDAVLVEHSAHDETPPSLPSSRAKPSARSCIICLENKRTFALVPCGHRCLCAACTDLSAIGFACPICREEATGVLRVFDP